MSDLETTLDDLCGRVNLRRRDETVSSSERQRPLGAYALWTSEYAQVLLASVALPHDAALEVAVGKWQDWFDDVLGQAEAAGAVVDGYLIARLEAKPHDALDVLRRLELSTQVCRKHVIWPDSNQQLGWRGLVSISVLGLPDPTPVEEMMGLPTLEPAVQRLWNDIDELGHNAVAQRDIAKVTSDDSD